MKSKIGKIELWKKLGEYRPLDLDVAVAIIAVAIR